MKRPLVIVAPNAFKNGPDAFDVAAALEKGLLRSKLAPRVLKIPIADGGDGTLSIIAEALGARYVSCEVLNPVGKKIYAEFGLTDDSRTAIIELANASGLRLLKKDEQNPLITSTYGTGQLMRAAIDKGAKTILLSVGGSATVDGGMGILAALGYRFRNAAGVPLEACGENLQQVAKAERVVIPANIKFVTLCDVKNPLTGSRGAARIFGPQKGATPQQVNLLERGLQNWAALIATETDKQVGDLEGGGAAGGVSAGLSGWLGAEIKPGADYILDLLQMEKHIKEADYIITAEGSLDSQTSEGKAPYALLQLAKRWNKPVIGLGGSIPAVVADDGLAGFDALFPIGNEPQSLDEAIANTLPNLERTAFNIGNVLFFAKG